MALCSVYVHQQADEAMKEEQQRRIAEDNKQVVHEQLIQAVTTSLSFHDSRHNYLTHGLAVCVEPHMN